MSLVPLHHHVTANRHADAVDEPGAARAPTHRDDLARIGMVSAQQLGRSRRRGD